jgi:protoporphyrinogen oxidase
LEIASSHGIHTADRAVVTAPAPVSASICPDLEEEERALMSGLRYQGIVCAALLCSRPLSPYYVTNLIDQGFPFTGVIEMTALVDSSAFNGNSLVYLPKYAAPDDPIFQEDDASVERSFIAGLRLIHPSLRDEEIRAFRVSRVRQVFTIPTIGYSRKLPPMRTSVEELHIVNGAHIVGGTLNVNETLALSERAFALLMERGDHATAICEPVAGSG